uniref:Reverse transcriptase domain-containing protein n=1 Tax=Sinocyclocheilus grahami TaxID=75366 RepID=A0A672RNE6_SINGR
MGKHQTLQNCSPKDRGVLSSSISKNEILEAIGSLKNGKAPGLDGFGHLISDQLLKVYSTSFEKGTLPQTFYQANTHLFLQKKSPPAYRPISLINTIAMIAKCFLKS